MDIEEYKVLFHEDESVGWWYIDQELEKIYPEQEPRHYAPKVPFVAGGSDPLDGISIYNSTEQEDHLHLVSYGMSELYYDEEAVGQEFSKWGFEFTVRLVPVAEDEEDPFWLLELLNNLARYVFESGNWFEPYHFVPTNGPIRLETDTEITGVVFVEDPQLGTLETAHGTVTFLQLVGITSKEVAIIEANPTVETIKAVVDELRQTNPLLITDLTRTNNE